jgi:hypothetical protein
MARLKYILRWSGIAGQFASSISRGIISSQKKKISQKEK